MDEGIEKAIQRVIDSMHENLDQQITVDDMARTAMFSKFHFSRVFQRVTGTSPGRYLTALRIQRAKKLLVSTTLNVKDISHEVGYSSVSTFISRFSRSVGVPPGRFRRLGGRPPHLPINRRRHAGRAQVRGHVWSPSTGSPGVIFVGLFTDRVPQSLPVACTVLTGPGPFVLENTPPGVWYLFAHLFAQGAATERENTAGPRCTGEQTILVGNSGPIVIHPDTTVRYADVRLTPMRPFDPPVLLATLNKPPSLT